MSTPAYRSLGYACFLILFWTSCQSGDATQNPQKTTQEKAPAATQKTTGIAKPKSLKFKRLNYENAAKELRAFGAEHLEREVEISTEFGNIRVRLYQDTPLHRANFIRLVKAKYYDQTQFYRVVKDFMIQGGNSDDTEIQGVKGKLGIYQIPAEFSSKIYHKRGALAMARVRENNPNKKSAPYSFYIVQGKAYTPEELRQVEEIYELKFNQEQTKVYTTLGGAPYLDFDHTVFGEVIEGMDVVDKIAAVKTDSREWPLKLIPTKMKILR